ncbi:glycosyltransferase [Cupriavidus respiraculi]|uniref:glycosyltransferase n=1 Tax=Cupriavidus respiraculi TaxID=195930 RepID=UPI001F2C2C98|nr:glycosyltransferase [Cupriavidus respiraculi]
MAPAEAAPMRILLLTTGLRLGGAEQQVAALAQRFVALGHAVAIVSLTPDCEVSLPAAAQVLRLDMRKTPWSMAAALWRVRGFVREWRPDVMHAHMVHANLFARVLTRFGGMPPLVCTAHSYREGGAARMLAYRLTDRWCRLTTHVGEQGRQRMIALRAVHAARIAVVPNGIDTARFRPDPTTRDAARAALGVGADTPLILNVGRLVPEKAQGLLLHAFAGLPTRHGARLLIAGEGPQRTELVQRIAQLGLQQQAQLLGARNDIAALLNAADLFVLSSDIEGMPIALGEALACGCPVVATDAPGVVELIGDRTGVVPRADAAALSAAMATALADGRGDAAAQAARHQRIASRLSLEAVARQWLDCYGRLADTATTARVETA